jgi:hypothetical protein
MPRKRDSKRWSQNVKTVSTFPPPGLFAKDAETVARVMATKKVSPRGIGSGIRMVQFFINRAGKNLPRRQRRELEKAKQILQEKASQQKNRRSSPHAKTSRFRGSHRVSSSPIERPSRPTVPPLS